MSQEEAAERGADGYAKLTSNELSFGPLPEAEAAIAEALPRANRYPDRHAGARRDGIAESTSVAVGVAVGAGEKRAGGKRLQRGASQPPAARRAPRRGGLPLALLRPLRGHGDHAGALVQKGLALRPARGEARGPPLRRYRRDSGRHPLQP